MDSNKYFIKFVNWFDASWFWSENHIEESIGEKSNYSEIGEDFNKEIKKWRKMIKIVVCQFKDTWFHEGLEDQ